VENPLAPETVESNGIVDPLPDCDVVKFRDEHANMACRDPLDLLRELVRYVRSDEERPSNH
jgi:hypothetical protein